MKTNTYRMLSLLSLLLVIGISAHAQEAAITADIPFDFHARRTELKAGSYIIRPISQGILSMRTSDGKTGVLLLTPLQISARSADTTLRLVFHRYANGQSFLTEVWTGAHHGLSLSTSEKERRLRKELLQQRLETRPRQVEIAAAVRR